jgi:hypothetical protein
MGVSEHGVFTQAKKSNFSIEHNDDQRVRWALFLDNPLGVPSKSVDRDSNDVFWMLRIRRIRVLDTAPSNKVPSGKLT